MCPDHASLGCFIQLHEVSLTGDFVIALTRTVLQVTGTDVATVAGDGTVVQAAASNSRTLTREAAAKAQDATLAARATRAEAAQATLDQRTAAASQG